MRAQRTCCVIISALGFLATACGLTASTVPTLLPSPAWATIFAILAVAIGVATWAGLVKGNDNGNSRTDDAVQENLQLQLEIETLRHLHTQLLEDKAFLQFMRADQDHERQLLALDLHDLSLPNLTAVLIQLETLNQRFEADDDSLDANIDLLRECFYQTRRVMNRLSPTLVQDEGVVASIERLAGNMESSIESLQIHHEVEFDRLSPLSECALVQLVREVLDQIRRHRGAQNVRLELVQEDDQLRLSITDDGSGAPIDSPRIEQCLDVLSGHRTPPPPGEPGQVMQIDFSVTDLIQSDTIKEKSRAFG